MILHEPFEISPRLLPAVRVAGAEISLDRTGRAPFGKVEWRWYIAIPAGEFEGDGLCSRRDTQGTFADLLDFLTSLTDEDDPFPGPVVEWARSNRDGIELLRLEIEETEGLIEE